jgi:hypothetical protein
MAGLFFWLAHGSHARRGTQRRAGSLPGRVALDIVRQAAYVAVQYKPFWRFRVDAAAAASFSKPPSLAAFCAFLKALRVNGS